MTDIDRILERLATDGDFAAGLAADPVAALSGYDVNADDVELLAHRIADGLGSAVEQRTSRAGFFGLLSRIVDGAAGTDRGISPSPCPSSTEESP